MKSIKENAVSPLDEHEGLEIEEEKVIFTERKETFCFHNISRVFLEYFYTTGNRLPWCEIAQNYGH